MQRRKTHFKYVSEMHQNLQSFKVIVTKVRMDSPRIRYLSQFLSSCFVTILNSSAVTARKNRFGNALKVGAIQYLFIAISRNSDTVCHISNYLTANTFS